MGGSESKERAEPQQGKQRKSKPNADGAKEERKSPAGAGAKSPSQQNLAAQSPIPALAPILESELRLNESKEFYLGGGGFGDVFRATYCQQPVAVKKLKSIANLSPEVIDSFRREVSVHQMLRHPNIIQLLGVSEARGLIVIELAEGNLDGALYKTETANYVNYTPLKGIEVMTQACCAVRYLHSMDILHRDMKPQNILLFAGWIAKVSDFGLSRVKIETCKMTQAPMGTPQYISPEIITDSRYDKACDVYSLSVTLNEALSRKIPFEGMGLAQIVGACLKGISPTPFHQTPFGGQLSLHQAEPLLRLISSGMTRDPNGRPTVDEYHSRMREILSATVEVSQSNVDVLLIQQVLRYQAEGNMNGIATIMTGNMVNAAVIYECCKVIEKVANQNVLNAESANSQMIEPLPDAILSAILQVMRCYYGNAQVLTQGLRSVVEMCRCDNNRSKLVNLCNALPAMMKGHANDAGVCEAACHAIKLLSFGSAAGFNRLDSDDIALLLKNILLTHCHHAAVCQAGVLAVYALCQRNDSNKIRLFDTIEGLIAILRIQVNEARICRDICETLCTLYECTSNNSGSTGRTTTIDSSLPEILCLVISAHIKNGDVIIRISMLLVYLLRTNQALELFVSSRVWNLMPNVLVAHIDDPFICTVSLSVFSRFCDADVCKTAYTAHAKQLLIKMKERHVEHQDVFRMLIEVLAKLN